jgi:hypothetical protein
MERAATDEIRVLAEKLEAAERAQRKAEQEAADHAAAVMAEEAEVRGGCSHSLPLIISCARLFSMLVTCSCFGAWCTGALVLSCSLFNFHFSLFHAIGAYACAELYRNRIRPVGASLWE